MMLKDSSPEALSQELVEVRAVVANAFTPIDSGSMPGSAERALTVEAGTTKRLDSPGSSASDTYSNR